MHSSLRLAPRWRKVWRDVFDHKLRTFLVVLSIAVGIGSIGTVIGSHVVISQDLPTAFAQTNPMHARIGIDGFDQALVKAIRRTPGVATGEGRGRVTVQVQVAPAQWRDLRLEVIDDFAEIEVSKIRPMQGAWPPGKHELLVERSSLPLLNAGIGDSLLVETSEGEQRNLRLIGTVHDLSDFSSTFTGVLYGYITLDTLEWLGWPREFTRLYFTVAEKPHDAGHIRTITDQVQEKIERSGHTVFWTFVPEPGKHEFEQFLVPALLIIGVIGLFSLLLSCFLVINIISAILAQQVRQIGVMKTIGARNGQITAMYLTTTLIFSLLALILALPLGWLGMLGYSNFIGGLMNFDITSTTLPPQVLALMTVVGLLTPALAALYPIIRGARITVREAISDYGMSHGNQDKGWIDRLIERIRGLSRPLLLSIRNTFRRKGRLILTLITLTLASAIFIAVFSVRASLLLTLDDALGYWRYDLSVDLSRLYRTGYLEQEALTVPGVTAAEAWGFWGTRRIRPNGVDGSDLLLIAPPPASTMIEPILLEGRWLQPGDETAVVINTDVLQDEPDLKVGDTLVLEINEREVAWQVVGIVRGVLAGPFVYANYPHFARVTRTVGRAAQLQVTIAPSDPATQNQVARRLDDHFRRIGISVNSIETTAANRGQAESQFQVLIVVLSSMAMLLAVVGGLGLMGTMSINVLERRREIGVMRAIGASSRSLLGIVIVEGLVIGVLSWLAGLILALPLSKALSDAVGAGFIQAELSYRFSSGGALLWLAVVLGIAAVASLLPARSAARLTVREVLAYE
jgi:putative ABC transport system permease protein